MFLVGFGVVLKLGLGLGLGCAWVWACASVCDCVWVWTWAWFGLCCHCGVSQICGSRLRRFLALFLSLEHFDPERTHMMALV